MKGLGKRSSKCKGKGRTMNINPLPHSSGWQRVEINDNLSDDVNWGGFLGMNVLEKYEYNADGSIRLPEASDEFDADLSSYTHAEGNSGTGQSSSDELDDGEQDVDKLSGAEEEGFEGKQTQLENDLPIDEVCEEGLSSDEEQSLEVQLSLTDSSCDEEPPIIKSFGQEKDVRLSNQLGKLVKIGNLIDITDMSEAGKEDDGNCNVSDDENDHIPSKRQKLTEYEEVIGDMSAWDGLFVPHPILAALSRLNFTAPTKIQALTLPSAIRDRRDIVGAAETGSGKTLAFGIPVLARAMPLQQNDPSRRRLLALVLTPTRELAMQIHRHLEAAATFTKLRVTAIVGGMSEQKQLRVLCKQRPEIVVATPGRLWDFMEKKEPHLTNLSALQSVVVDEADRMVEKSHFEEMTKILHYLQRKNNALEKFRQTFIFSATLSMVPKLKYDKIKVLKKKKTKSKFIGEMTGQEKIAMMMGEIGVRDKPKIVDLTETDKIPDRLTEARLLCNTEDKDKYLYYFTRQFPRRTLVFCNSIECVRRLTSVLVLLQANPLPLHAEMHQTQRLKNLDRFRERSNGLLVATEVAARGIDIPDVEHVVHFQVPKTAENYVHRSGRSGRAFKSGLSLMLIEPGDMPAYRKILATLNRSADLPMFPVDPILLGRLSGCVALARQIDVEEHRASRRKQTERWYVRAAEELGVELDQHHRNEFADDDDDARKTQLRLKGKKRELQHLLKVPVRITASFVASGGMVHSFVHKKPPSTAVEAVQRKLQGPAKSSPSKKRKGRFQRRREKKNKK